jgi:hypothetical protein
LAVRVPRCADLDVGEPDLSEGIGQRLVHVPQPAGKTFDHGSEGIHREASLFQIRWLRRQMERRELEEPVGVIGHHHLDGSSEQLLADLVELGLVDRAGILLPAGRSRALRARSTCTTSIRRRFGCGRGTVDLVLSVRCPQAAHRRGSYRLMLVAKRYGVLIELVEPMI